MSNSLYKKVMDADNQKEICFDEEIEKFISMINPKIIPTKGTMGITVENKISSPLKGEDMCTFFLKMASVASFKGSSLCMGKTREKLMAKRADVIWRMTT